MLYFIEHNAQEEYLYAYKNISLKGFFRDVCHNCNRQILTAEYIDTDPHLLLEGGTLFPDYLQFCDAGERLFLISEKTLNLFEQNKISGYTGYRPVPYEVTSGSLKHARMPNYYCLNISGKIDFDLKAMHLKKKKVCPVCNQFNWNRMRLYPRVLNVNTWDGSDLCSLNSIPGLKICSELLVKVVENNNLTGFAFQPGL